MTIAFPTKQCYFLHNKLYTKVCKKIFNLLQLSVLLLYTLGPTSTIFGTMLPKTKSKEKIPL